MPGSLRKTILGEGIHAAAFIPLVEDGRVIGKFMTYYNKPHAFSDEDMELSMNIAGQLALAVVRKRAEAALVESEKMHRAFFSQTEVGMTCSDLKGRIISANNKLCEIVGYTESELLGKGINELSHINYQAKTRRLFSELVRNGKPYHIEKQYIRKAGSLVWVNVTASAIRDARGKTQAVVAVVRDISERKEAQLKLEEAKRYLESRVQERTRELVSANEQLQSEIQRRKGTEGEILEISEREQRRIGQELHDSVCQHLTAVAFMARSMAQRVKDHRVLDVDDIERIAELINQGVTETRTIARGLHPVEMNPDGFVAALQTLLHHRSQLPFRLDMDEQISIADPAVALHLFRIASEAIINANKHAQATSLMVRVRRLRKQIELSVTDNGVGMGPKKKDGSGMGFHIMEYRARSIGARLEISPAKPRGTRVACICLFYEIQG